MMPEHSLHLDIKRFYSLPGDVFEVKLGDYVVDILRRDLIIEVQTKNFSALKEKLQNLLKTRQVRLVYPLPETKWITYLTKEGIAFKRCKSPKKGVLIDLFRELVRIPNVLGEDNFSLEVLFIDEEEVRCDDGKGSWRRRGISVKERRLVKVNARILFKNKKDYLQFLPEKLNDVFTNKEFAKSAKIPVKTARQITYCLRKSDIIQVAEKKGKTLYFQKI